VEVLNLASVGAISESLREFRNPAPTLFVWVEDNYRVRAGFALAGRVLAGSNGRAGTIFAESGDLVSIGDNPALLKYQSWTSLLAAAIELDGQAKAAHELLVARLAERLQDLAAFLDPSQVVIGSADPTLGADIAARISRGWALRVSGAPMPSVERALFGGSTLARGAALLPIASVISRALEIEELEPSRKAGPTGSAGVLRMFAA
jgi:predicted NBD/HSP70 family sugar kinase